MELNPYQPPVVGAPTLADEQHAGDRPAPRPIGIWILSGLHLLVGLLLLFATAVFLARVVTGRAIDWNSPIGFIVVVCALVTALALATSIGMWRGARWGWWLTAFYYVWAVLGVVADLGLKYWTMGPLDSGTMADILPAKLTQIAVHGLILLYLFKGTVRDFFGLQSLRMATALVVLALIVIVLVAAMIYVQGLQGVFEPF